MKKLSLKPLGESCMNMLCKGGLFIGLLMTFSLAACSDDDDDTVTPVFPEKQNIVCNAGQTKEFTFTTNTNWSLTSSAIWCKFKKNDTEEHAVSGTAGSQTVTIVATEDDQKVDNISVAKLELTMGGQTIVIGEVTRSAVGYDLKIFDADGNEIDPNNGELKVGYQEFASFSVEANFRFAATNLPGWVELEGGALVGAVNQKVSGGLKMINDNSREKYPIVASEKNVITFSDDEGKAFYTIRVSYDGMTPGAMDLTLPSSNKYGWSVSLDGKTFTQSGGSVAGTSGSATTIKNRLPFTVKTLNDDYEVVFVEKGGDNNLYIMDASYNEWMHCEGEKGNATLIVDEYTPASYEPAERDGYVLVFSRAEYESIKDNLEETIINGEELVYKYEQANLIVQFTQKETKGGGDEAAITAVDGQTYNPIECTSYSGGDADYFKSEYGVSGVYEIKQPALSSTIVTMPFNWSDIAVYYFETEQQADGVIEPYTETDISISTDAANGQDIFLVVSDESGNKLMLIVRISNAGSGGGEEAVAFTVTDNMMSPISCTPYDGSLGGGSYFKDTYGVADISDIKNPPVGKSMFITLNSSSIVSFQCYDTEEKEIDASFDIEMSEDWMTGKQNLMVWLGDGSALTQPVFLIITGEDGSKHMLVINI